MPNNWNCLVPLTPLLEKLTHRLSRYSFESGGWSGSSAISLSLPSWIRVRLSFCFWTYQVKSLIALLTHCRSWISDWVGSLMGFFISLMWFCVTMVLEYFFFYCFSFLSVLSTLRKMWHNILHFWILHFTELGQAKLWHYFLNWNKK